MESHDPSIGSVPEQPGEHQQSRDITSGKGAASAFARMRAQRERQAQQQPSQQPWPEGCKPDGGL
jgi:hypothetical protein